MTHLTDCELLARINSRSSAMRAYLRADLRWHEESREREACSAELSALAAERKRRQGYTN